MDRCMNKMILLNQIKRGSVCRTYPAKQIIDPNKMLCKNVISASRLFYIFTFGASKQLHYGKAFQPRALVAIA